MYFFLCLPPVQTLPRPRSLIDKRKFTLQLHLSMNNIRTFIVCSSLLLVAWLSAAYTAQLDNPGTLTKAMSASESVPSHQDSAEKKESVTATAALTRIK
jgi:hypothetical protein